MQEPLVEDRMPASDALKILKGETSPAAVSRCVPTVFKAVRGCTQAF